MHTNFMFDSGCVGIIKACHLINKKACETRIIHNLLLLLRRGAAKPPRGRCDDLIQQLNAIQSLTSAHPRLSRKCFGVRSYTKTKSERMEPASPLLKPRPPLRAGRAASVLKRQGVFAECAAHVRDSMIP